MRRTGQLFAMAGEKFSATRRSLMNDVAQLIERIEHGDAQAADQLLPIVYDQLRRLARKQISQEAVEQSLQSADLVHEAYLRLVGSNVEWQGRGHFLAAAAEAMRRILVERARKKRRIKHGGKYSRVELSDAAAQLDIAPDEVITVSDLLESLTKQYPREAQIVKLHYFAGLTISEAGEAIGISSRTAYRYWTFARAWLHEAIRDDYANSEDR
jgi:RNA polymerase sigma factor (TIGR02999 family)